MIVELSVKDLKEILEWCEGVEQADMPWVPMEIPLYRKLRVIYTYQSSDTMTMDKARDIRENIIERDRELLEKLNTGSKKVRHSETMTMEEET